MPRSESDDDDEERGRKRAREKSEKKHDKDKKKHKHESKHDKKDSKKDKHKRTEREPTSSPRVSEPITETDYFVKAPEFSLWLTEARGSYIDELSSEEARRLFAKFVKKWNGGELSSKFYVGVPAAQAVRTRHQWGFAASLSESDQLTLDRTKDGVDSATQQQQPSRAPGGVSHGMGQSSARPSEAPATARGPIGPSRR